MRDIRFRAWDTTRKKMFSAEKMGQDQLTLSPDGRGFVNVSGVSTKLSQYLSHLIPMQYTGIKDKNKEEIYDGDIIQAINPIKLERGKQADYTGLVAWSTKSLAWVLVDKNGKFIDMLCRVEQPEIIGNIIDNPELMEQDNE